MIDGGKGEFAGSVGLVVSQPFRIGAQKNGVWVPHGKSSKTDVGLFFERFRVRRYDSQREMTVVRLVS